MFSGIKWWNPSSYNKWNTCRRMSQFVDVYVSSDSNEQALKKERRIFNDWRAPSGNCRGRLYARVPATHI